MTRAEIYQQQTMMDAFIAFMNDAYYPGWQDSFSDEAIEFSYNEFIALFPA
jgi:hypothetical protein